MEKRKVVQAYRNGMITLRECAQILGIELRQMPSFIRETNREEAADRWRRTVET